LKNKWCRYGEPKIKMMGKILGITAEPLPNGTENLRAVKKW
jgi:hypothetical protein